MSFLECFGMPKDYPLQTSTLKFLFIILNS